MTPGQPTPAGQEAAPTASGQLAGLLTGQQTTQGTNLAATAPNSPLGPLTGAMTQVANGVQARPGQPTPGEAPLTGTGPATPAGPGGANSGPGGGPGAGPGGNAPGVVSMGPWATPNQNSQQAGTGPAGPAGDPALTAMGPRAPPGLSQYATGQGLLSGRAMAPTQNPAADSVFGDAGPLFAAAGDPNAPNIPFSVAQPTKDITPSTGDGMYGRYTPDPISDGVRKGWQDFENDTGNTVSGIGNHLKVWDPDTFSRSWSRTGDVLGAVADNPGAAGRAVWNGMTDPLVESYKSGGLSEAIPRGAVGALTMGVGTKGLGNLHHLSTLEHLGDDAAALRPLTVPRAGPPPGSGVAAGAALGTGAAMGTQAALDGADSPTQQQQPTTNQPAADPPTDPPSSMNPGPVAAPATGLATPRQSSGDTATLVPGVLPRTAPTPSGTPGVMPGLTPGRVVPLDPCLSPGLTPLPGTPLDPDQRPGLTPGRVVPLDPGLSPGLTPGRVVPLDPGLSPGLTPLPGTPGAAPGRVRFPLPPQIADPPQQPIGVPVDPTLLPADPTRHPIGIPADPKLLPTDPQRQPIGDNPFPPIFMQNGRPGPPEDSAPSGSPAPELSPQRIQDERGILIENQRGIQDEADRHNATFDVRPVNTDSVQPRLDGAEPKPEWLKAKTINGYDVLLNPALAGHEGTVAFFDPGPPPNRGAFPNLSETQWNALRKRHDQRLGETQNTKLNEDINIRTDEGKVRVDDGIVQTRTGDGWKPFAGDNDLFNVTRNGEQLPTEEYNAIIDEMRGADIGVMHGAHMYWPYTPGEKSMFESIRDQHMPGPDGEPASEPLVRFSPNTPPTLVDGEGNPWTPPNR